MVSAVATSPTAASRSAGIAPLTGPLAPPRTIWGLDPLQLHTRFWAAHGVQVVRQGEPSQIVKHAELFLLTDPRSLVIFKLAPVMDVLNWIEPQVLFIRLHDTRERGYREKVITDNGDRFLRFQRLYESANRLARVVLTPEREVAQLWQSASDPLTGWRRLRKQRDAGREHHGGEYERPSHLPTMWVRSLLFSWQMYSYSSKPAAHAIV